MKPNQITYPKFRALQKSFTSEDGEIKYIDTGEGSVIVLLHGVPTSGWLYRKMIDSLAKNHRVIVPDMLGFGSSDSPDGYEIYSEQNHAKRLLALMDSLGIETWQHIMHDAGGLWTWELLKQQPSRISKLVVLNTIIYEEGFKPPIRFKKGVLARTAMWGYRNGITTNIMLRGLFKSGLRKNTLNKIDIEGYKTPLLEGKTSAMYYFFTRTCYNVPKHEEVLKSFSKPVTIIWGQHDEFLLWEPQRANVISDLNVLVKDVHLIEAKHFIQEEMPSEITQKILDFLK
jgi:pimeloyl-ACP methyl ester carboxylesterase